MQKGGRTTANKALSRSNAPDRPACLRPGAEFVQDQLKIPGLLRILKADRVGDAYLGSGPVVGDDDEMPSLGKMSRSHQCDQDISAGQRREHAFHGVIGKRRRFKSECFRTFRDEFMFRAMSRGPVAVFRRPRRHIRRRIGRRGEAGYDHGKSGRPASIGMKRILSAIEVVCPSDVRLIIVCKGSDAAL